jgi:3-oxoadipate enol-lactonase
MRRIMTCGVCASVMAFASCSGASSGESSSASTTDSTAPVDSGFVAVDGARLYYESVGLGDPVVLLHGGNLDSRMWEPQFLELARDHRVVRYDARGFGRSAGSDTPYAAHDDLLALLDTLHLDRVSLVGLSLGGRIAIDFTLAHPERVERLVLVGPGMSGWRFSNGDTAWVVEARKARDRGDSVGIAMAWLQSDYMRPAMEQPELRTRLTELTTANSSNWMALVRRGDVERGADPPAVGRTAQVRARTLLIIGSRDVPDIFRIVDTLHATIPGAQRLVIDGAGHMVNMEQPDKFIDIVRDFLRR